MNEKIYLMEMQHNTNEHETDRLIASESATDGFKLCGS